MTNTLEEVLSTLQRVESTAQAILGKLQISGNQITVGSLDEISGALGLVKAGEFRSGVGEPNYGFTGIRMGAPGWTYDNRRYSIVGLKNDVLQFGLSNEDGAVYAGGGAVTLDVDGINLYDIGTGPYTSLLNMKYKDPGTGDIYDMGRLYSDYGGTDGTVVLACDHPDTAPWTGSGITLSATFGANTTQINLLSTASSEAVTISADTLIDLNSLGEISSTAKWITVWGANLDGLTEEWDSHSLWVREFNRTYATGAYTFLEGSVFVPPTYISSASTVDTASTVTIQGAPNLTGLTADHAVGLLAGGGIRLVSGKLELLTNLAVENGGTLYDTFALHPLPSPASSTSFDGDAFSTATATLIDLSAAYGLPAGIKAVLVRVYCRDSASAATAGLYVALYPDSTSTVGALAARPSGMPNDYIVEAQGVVPCNANGDIYYTVGASGAGTMDVWLYIFGYYL